MSHAPPDRRRAANTAAPATPEPPPLARIARALASACDADEVAWRVAEGALLLTEASGAYVERVISPRGTVEVAAAVGAGAPPLGTRVPYPGSLTEEIIEGGIPAPLAKLERIGESIAPYLARSCGGCSGLVVPLAAEGEVLGALVLLRPAPAPGFPPAEAMHARILGDLAGLSLRRALLLASEREARAAAEVAVAEAEEANRARSDFLANMSHELRTPVNAVIGYAELLEMGIGGPLTPEQREQLGRIQGSSRHLLALIDEVLDLAKIESGRMVVGREAAPVTRALDRALEGAGPRAEACGLALEAACDGEPEYVGDATRVEQILAHLLSNAVKFTKRGGRVTLRCAVHDRPDRGARLEGEGPWVAVSVEDTGIGIAPEQLGAVFHPFVQAERGRARTHGGAGLGLALSRELARLMGGDLTARSALGEGSCFTLWLPARGAAPAAAAPVPDRRRAPRPQPELVSAGRVLQARLDEAVARFVRRLRAEDALFGARDLSAPELEDHVAAYLAELATSLIVLGETGGEPELMRDGSDLQRMLSERHGAQRARLGWSEDALRREFSVLREEVEALVRAEGGPAAAAAAGVVARFVDRACQISLRGMRLSASERARRGAEADALIAHTHRTIERTRHTLRRVQKSVGIPPKLRGRRDRPESA